MNAKSAPGCSDKTVKTKHSITLKKNYLYSEIECADYIFISIFFRVVTLFSLTEDEIMSGFKLRKYMKVKVIGAHACKTIANFSKYTFAIIKKLLSAIILDES